MGSLSTGLVPRDHPMRTRMLLHLRNSQHAQMAFESMGQADRRTPIYDIIDFKIVSDH